MEKEDVSRIIDDVTHEIKTDVDLFEKGDEISTDYIDDTEYVYVCYNCKKIYSFSKYEDTKCFNCTAPLIALNIDISEWVGLPSDEQRRLLEDTKKTLIREII